MIELNHNEFKLIGESGYPHLVRAGGKIYVLNSSSIIRLLPDGSPDLSFDSDALAYLVEDGLIPYHLTVSNGMVTVFGMVRGSHPTPAHKAITFPETGRTGSSFSVKDLPSLHGAWANESTLDSAGNLYITGGAMTPQLSRMDSNGDKDSVYSSTASTTLQSAKLHPGTMIADSTGGLYVSGSIEVPVDYATNTPARFVPAVLKLSPSGGIDTSFGTDGIVMFSDNTSASSMALTKSGELLVGLSGGQARVTKLDLDGKPVSNFGQGGAASIDLNGSTLGGEYVKEILVSGDQAFAVIASYPKHTVTIVPIGDTDFIAAGKLQVIDDSRSEMLAATIDPVTQKIQLAVATWSSGGIETVSIAYGGDMLAPSVLSFNPASSGAAVGQDIAITFNEPIQRGSGLILLKLLDGSVAATFYVENSHAVTIDGSTLRINPPNDLNAATSYIVELSAGIVKDVAGNPLANSMAFRFSTVGTPEPQLGTNGNDRFINTANGDTVDGTGGTDAITYSNIRSEYVIVKTADGATVKHISTGVVDSLLNIERVHFADSAVAFDFDGNAGQAYRIFKAGFGRTPDPSGLGFWISMIDQGASLISVAQGFVSSSEFTSSYPSSLTTSELVGRFYKNILGREVEPGGLSFWAGVIDRGGATLAEVLAALSESQENKDGLIEVVGNGFPFTPYG